ncbi:MAG: nicotinate-nucleotide adenylyltransferase [Burkholderiales bacterium]|nr:nicotinate-nucleotide adenylyltransferase [Pseudomonadota bacterium]MDA1011214.1 nicotinate-nucleotide adenylyltransferase [Pseudomonadota bacterium]
MVISSRIGVLGGTFDPIHFAHLRLAEEVAEAFLLDTVRLIPSADPPHRTSPGASAQDRLRMVRLALESAGDHLVADGSELERVGKSYMVDTLKALREENPSESISLILGTDAFIELMTWYEWQQLFTLAHIIVASRPNLPISQLKNKLKGELFAEFEQRNSRDYNTISSSTHGLIYTYEFTSLEVSGTSLRKRIQNGLSLKYLLPDNVINYIQDYSLYEESRSESNTE